MALLSADSFDHYATADIFAKWTTPKATTTQTIVAAQGRRGSQAMRLNPSGPAGSTIARTLNPATPTAFVVGLAVKVTVRATASPIFVLCEAGGTCQLGVGMNLDGTLYVSRGGDVFSAGFISTPPALSGNSSAILNLNEYYYIELKGVISDTVGSYELRVNGISQFSASNVDTRNGGTGNWSQIAISARVAVGSDAVNFYVDDLYVLDTSGAYNNTFLGDVRIDPTYPTGGGGDVSQWTPSVGSNNSANVDSVLAQSVTYNEAASAALTDTYEWQNTVITDPVIGLHYCAYAQKTDAGAATVKAITRLAGVDYEGALSLAPSQSSWIYQLQPIDVNPATGLPFTEAEFNAAQFGIIKTV